ncbi:MAG: Clp protease ClpP [Candidatus Marinimicrobia bacterium]|nr:Clp protease ClpP [Candidatus Neomarinimicrobiota bacterium]
MKEDLYWMKKEEEKNKKPEAQIEEKSRPPFIEIVDNRIYFYSEINVDKILQLNRHLRNKGVDLQREAMVQSRKPANIYLHIQSYGGSIFAGMAGMDEIIKSVVPVYTMVDGCCASAATFLSVCGKKRFINRHAYMLIHQLSSFMWGKYEDFKDEMKNLDKIMVMIKQVYAEYTKIPEAKLEGILKHDLWFDANECIEYGLVDEIII